MVFLADRPLPHAHSVPERGHHAAGAHSDGHNAGPHGGHEDEEGHLVFDFRAWWTEPEYLHTWDDSEVAEQDFEQEGHIHVTWGEVFFDLFYVVAARSVTHALEHRWGSVLLLERSFWQFVIYWTEFWHIWAFDTWWRSAVKWECGLAEVCNFIKAAGVFYMALLGTDGDLYFGFGMGIVIARLGALATHAACANNVISTQLPRARECMRSGFLYQSEGVAKTQERVGLLMMILFGESIISLAVDTQSLQTGEFGHFAWELMVPWGAFLFYHHTQVGVHWIMGLSILCMGAAIGMLLETRSAMRYNSVHGTATERSASSANTHSVPHTLLQAVHFPSSAPPSGVEGVLLNPESGVSEEEGGDSGLLSSSLRLLSGKPASGGHAGDLPLASIPFIVWSCGTVLLCACMCRWVHFLHFGKVGLTVQRRLLRQKLPAVAIHNRVWRGVALLWVLVVFVIPGLNFQWKPDTLAMVLALHVLVLNLIDMAFAATAAVMFADAIREIRRVWLSARTRDTMATVQLGNLFLPGAPSVERELLTEEDENETARSRHLSVMSAGLAARRVSDQDLGEEGDEEEGLRDLARGGGNLGVPFGFSSRRSTVRAQKKDSRGSSGRATRVVHFTGAPANSNSLSSSAPPAQQGQPQSLADRFSHTSAVQSWRERERERREEEREKGGGMGEDHKSRTLVPPSSSSANRPSGDGREKGYSDSRGKDSHASTVRFAGADEESGDGPGGPHSAVPTEDGGEGGRETQSVPPTGSGPVGAGSDAVRVEGEGERAAEGGGAFPSLP
uniref:Uncharacterized protein n=1 Tax=Chromera velia CCMP2878 TaxID=1169474 RepID=A0A0G4HE61_9ALVE|eukprot:Cvel_26647.t1-p1 / transcript=Cvel_26647.t1 / gene=Cvel_26647 / organism=Chromera_velia_CCMP2878 / gene_product=hypothetical protein / transcript_product=hypothetical protein / location=Cvel_scaffold3205:5297-12581(+) / protein_length=786 / sequence_SO=supercontig / SO=protein_coding / is_pseudo=false